jgi:enoyl-CoA hydratase
MTDSPVLLERHGPVAVVTLNLPSERNLLSVALVTALSQTYDELERDDGARCVVLTGAGSAFCAGAHLGTLEAAASGDFGPVEAVYEGFLRVLSSPLPTIGAINGPAVGAGFNLALACDVRLASGRARFDTRFAALHLHPGGGHTWLLTRAVGPQQAFLGCLFGEVWSAQDALERGLVASVHAEDDLLAAAVELGSRLAGHSTEYVRRLTASLREASSGATHAQLLEHEAQAQQWSLSQPEFLAGLQRIRAKIAGAS